MEAVGLRVGFYISVHSVHPLAKRKRPTAELERDRWLALCPLSWLVRGTCSQSLHILQCLALLVLFSILYMVTTCTFVCIDTHTIGWILHLRENAWCFVFFLSEIVGRLIMFYLFCHKSAHFPE